MGLLDFLKPKPRLRPADLATTYRLRFERSDNPVIAGSAIPDWWIGEISGVQITMRGLGARLEVVVGEMAPGVDYVLRRVDAAHPLPPADSGLRLEARGNPPHSALTAWYFEIPPHPMAVLDSLRDPCALDALGQLSQHVGALPMYRRGVELVYPVHATAAELHRDIALALRIQAPLEKRWLAQLASKRSNP